jgi:uncharacterized protein YndB with AHSA1/START domain
MTHTTHNETTLTTPSDTEIRIERIIEAPRELVWEAYTDPELIAQWLGPRDIAMTDVQMDVREGGTYRFTHARGDETFRFFGEYRELDPPKALEWTFNFEGFPRGSVDRTEFEELDGGRTRIVTLSTFESKEDRDNMLNSGMEHGVREGFERLDELLAARQS